MVLIRAVLPAEYERVGDVTVASYAALPVDHLWDGYDTEIRDVAKRVERAEILVAVLDGEIVGAVTYVSDPDSEWAEWNEPDEAQIRLLAVDTAVQGRGIGEALVRACIDAHASKGSRSCCTPRITCRPRSGSTTRLGFVRRPERDVHDFEAEHDMTFYAFTLDPAAVTPAG